MLRKFTILLIKKAINFIERTTFSVKFRDFPLCLDERLVDYDSNVAPYFVIIWDDFNTYKLLSEQSDRIVLPMCEFCSLQNQCTGVLAANFYKYDKYTDWAKVDER